MVFSNSMELILNKMKAENYATRKIVQTWYDSMCKRTKMSH